MARAMKGRQFARRPTWFGHDWHEAAGERSEASFRANTEFAFDDFWTCRSWRRARQYWERPPL